jgi:hypothetical protein
VAGLTASIDSIAGPEINLKIINPKIITDAMIRFFYLIY